MEAQKSGTPCFFVSIPTIELNDTYIVGILITLFISK